MSAWDPWSYRESTGRTTESPSTVGYKVHATDGEIGKIDRASSDVDTASIVVDTGPWIFGRLVILPAGTIERVDDDEEEVYVDLTKEQIKDSPELMEGATFEDPAYRQNIGGYYGGFYL